MSIKVECKHCGAMLKASAKHVGRKARCNKCKKAFVVSQKKPAQVPPASPVPVVCLDCNFSIPASGRASGICPWCQYDANNPPEKTPEPDVVNADDRYPEGANPNAPLVAVFVMAVAFFTIWIIAYNSM
jgi:hypothetical protein